MRKIHQRYIPWHVLISVLTVLMLIISLPAFSKETKKSRFFNLTLITPIGNPPREKAGQIIARDLEKIGIGINLRYMEFASISPRENLTAKTGKAFDEGGFDLYIVQSSMDSEIDPSGMYREFACDQFFPAGSNQIRYCSKIFDESIYKALKIRDNEKRYNTARLAQKALYEDLPSVPLWVPSQFYGVRSTVQFPKDKDQKNWQTYALRWARREINGKPPEKMSLRERTLIYAQPTDVDAFLEGFSRSGYCKRAVAYMCYDALSHQTAGSYYRGPKNERGPKPALAESWKISDDQKIWTINLRKDVLWHDGNPFTADDVIFTYDLIANKDAGYDSDIFFRQNGITWKKIDSHTVKFQSKTFSPLFGAETLRRPILPKHLLGNLPPADIIKSELNTSKMVGTGPFMLVEYKPGEYFKYKANDKYYGGKPAFDFVVIRIIPQSATAWYALKTGEVDMTEKWYGFAREIVDIKADPNLYAIMEPSFGPHQIRINNDHPKLKSQYVRKAISLACNRKVMVDVISNGLGIVSTQHLPESNPGFVKELAPLEYSLNEAKKMMVKAGFDYSTITIKGPEK